MLSDVLQRLRAWFTLSPQQQKALAAELSQKHRRTQTIMFSDMAGFSKKTRLLPDISLLAQWAHFVDIAKSATSRYNGRILRSIGDDLFWAFNDPLHALATARAIQRGLESHNAGHSPLEQIITCFGIACGPVLDCGNDMYGEAVNIASKLAEDIGDGQEILLAEKALLHLPAAFQPHFTPKRVSISGISFTYYSLAAVPPVDVLLFG